jgi:hypothetical protein
MTLNDPLVKEFTTVKVAIGKLQNEVKNLGEHLGEKIENLAKCKNDHEERISDLEKCCITRAELKEVQEEISEKLEILSKKIDDNGTTKLKLGVLSFLGSFAAAIMVTVFAAIILHWIKI